MSRINALSILNAAGSTEEQLAELHGQVIENVQKSALSARLKNGNWSGDPTSGTVEFDRFANAVSQAYGTARAAAAGNKLKDGKIKVSIDQDKEIVEEIEAKDVKLFGVPNIIARRGVNHGLRMAAELDRAFFNELVAAGAEHTFTATDLEDRFEELVQLIETTNNQYVDGVDRSMIYVTVKPSIYGAFKNKLNTLNDRYSENESILGFNGVEVLSNTRQTADWIVATYQSVGQPVTVDQYQDEKINLSNAHAVELFYHYGTKCLTPDLVHFAGAAGSSV
jgi:hypothetical protein